MDGTLPREFQELQALIRGYQRSRAVTVAAELGIADLLRDGRREAEELAVATSTHAQTLYRLLRALASIGIVHEGADRRFELTAMGQYLRRDHPLSVQPVACMIGAEYEWRAWGELQHSVRTGENAAVHVLGCDVWEYRRRHPEHGEVFDAAMRALSRVDTAGILAAHDFGKYGTVADIGGGTGAVLAAVLAAHPAVRGILFDQPPVVAGADRVLGEAGVAERATVVPGDFFVEVPAGADAYILARVLHDWSDEDAMRILRRVRVAMTADASVLLLEAVVGPPNEDPLIKFLDLMMLVSAGGLERTEGEWRALLAGADLELSGVARAGPTRHVIEAAPAGMVG